MTNARLGKLKGLPFRPTQEQAIDFINQSSKQYIAVRAPTGVGKTCLGFESIKQPFFYVCSSIPLQQQAEDDYPESILLKGRGNYYCPDLGTADLCIQASPCDDCEYDRAKCAALSNPITILNFHYFLHAANFTQKFPLRNIIIDEADSIESVLVGFISFEFTEAQLKWLGIMAEMPDKKTKISVMPRWLELRHVEVEGVIEDIEPDVKDIIRRAKGQRISKPDTIILKRWKALQSVEWKLRFLMGQDLSKNWIYKYEDWKKKINLKPIWLSRDLVDRFLLSHGDKFLFMSATLPSKEVFCGMYGFKSEEVDYIDLPNVWDSEKRHVIYRPEYNLSFKNKNEETYGKVREAVVKIMDEQKGRGIIHTVSYQLAEIIGKLNSGRLVLHSAGNKKDMFEYFKKKDGAIWVSPSSTRGLDLPYDMCEWVVWLKAPFLHIQDPQVNARLYGSGKFGKVWYASDAVQSIIQGCGRGFRSEDDYCTVYMLDEQIGRLLKEQAKLFPMWFRDLVAYE